MKITVDPTQEIRRGRLETINSAVKSRDPISERERLEAKYGRVWDAHQLSATFEVLGFMAPYVVVHRKADGLRGSLEFQHSPRFYFNLILD